MSRMFYFKQFKFFYITAIQVICILFYPYAILSHQCVCFVSLTVFIHCLCLLESRKCGVFF